MYKSGEGLLGHVADDSHARDHRISVPGKVGTVGPRVEVLVLFVPHSARRRAWHSTGQAHVAHGPTPRALFDPCGSHVLAEGLFTRYCGWFAPAT